MLSNYIKNLIDIHSRVIVPDLGAFMLKGDSSKTIYFNEFLRFNDGLLVDHIAEQEQIDKIEAAKKIKIFVDDVNKQLAGNKSVNIEGIGTLYLDINEKIQLKTPESAESKVVKPAEPEVELKPREIDFELERTEPSPAQPKTQTVNTGQIPTPTPKSKTEPSVEPPVKESKSTIGSTVKPKEPQAPVAKERKTAPPTPPRRGEPTIDVVPTTTRRMVLVSIIGVLVIGAIVYFAFFRTAHVNQNITIGANKKSDSTSITNNDTASKAMPVVRASKNKTSPSQTAEVKHKEPAKAEPKNKVIADNQVKQAPVQKATPVTSATASGGKKFYVIAGTFSVEANADRMVKKLKNEGHNSQKLRNDAKNVYYVSYSSFVDKASAAQELKKIKAAGNDGWIYSF